MSPSLQPSRKRAAAALLACALLVHGCGSSSPTRPPAVGVEPGHATRATVAECDRTEGWDAIVVGAGLAGIAAGRELVHLGRRILVLEAADRIGGRGFVGHIRAGGEGDPPVPIDYGGAWIHGVPTNPLTALVDSYGFERVRSELEAPFYVDGRRASDEEDEAFGEAWEAYEEALETAARRIEHEKLLAEEACAEGEAVAEGAATGAELCSHLEEGVPDDAVAERLCALADDVVAGSLAPEAFCATASEQIRVTSDVAATALPDDPRLASAVRLVAATAGPLETSTELTHSSAVDAAGFYAGEDDLVDRGMGAFVEAYGAGLPVCLETPVRRVAWGEDGVRVEAGGRTYQARTVLVTASVGVLASGGIAFEPPLPEWKRAAIEGLAMGHMQKVILPFRDAALFADEPENVWVLVDTALTPSERELAERHGVEVEEPARRVMAFVLKPLGAPIAIAFFGGEWAKLYESLCAGEEAGSGPRSDSGCDDPAIETSVRALGEIYGADAVERGLLAEHIHVTRWSLDPHTLGAYSVPRPGQWDQRAALARPVAAGDDEDGPLRVFFAGEAASRAIYNGSYPGAFETGLAAAREIHVELTDDR